MKHKTVMSLTEETEFDRYLHAYLISDPHWFTGFQCFEKKK